MAAEDWGDTPTVGGSWWDTAKGVAKSADETAGDAIRAFTNAVTFGNMDRFVGYMNSGGPQTLSGLVTGQKPLTYEQAVNAEVAKSEAARARSPYASIAGDVAGAVALPGLGAESLAARYGSGALARAGAYGLTGAATGAAQGAGNTYTGNLPDYVKNAAVGGVLGSALGGAGGALFGRGPPQIRGGSSTAADLFAVGDQGYKTLAQSKARYEPDAFRRAGDDIADTLYNKRFTERDSPYAWRGVDEIRGEGAPSQPNLGYGAPVAPSDVEWVRQGLNRTPRTPEAATDRAAGQIVRRGLDDFVTNPPAGAVLPGLENEAATASRLATEARGNWAGAERVQALEDIIHNARGSAAAANSGLNTENNLRQGVKAFTKKSEGVSPAELAGYNADEVAALENYVKRGSGQGANLMRWGSNLVGSGQGLGGVAAGATLGGATYYGGKDPETALATGLGTVATGLLLRKVGNARAEATINALRDKIAERTPSYQFRLASGGLQPGVGYPGAAKGVRDAVALELLNQTRPTRVPIDTTDWQ